MKKKRVVNPAPAKPERFDSTKTISALVTEVVEATKALASAKTRAQRAHEEAFNAHGRLNKAQRALDSAYQQFRINAPIASEWKP